MLKYVDSQVTFAEIPYEITLCINISGCKNACPECHSAYLALDIGEILNNAAIDKLILNNRGISAICLMGGDNDPTAIETLVEYIKIKYPELKIGWYSGKQKLVKEINLKNLDFIKLGPYKKECGPLNNKDTNQRFYHINNGIMEDWTYKFWKNDTNNN